VVKRPGLLVRRRQSTGETRSPGNPARALILTSDMGFGHRSAANAVKTALENQHGGQVAVEIVNAFEHESLPGWLKEDPTNYNRLVRERPDLYQKGYQVLNQPLPTTLYEAGLTVILGEAVTDIVRRHKPDVIVVTHPNYLAPLKSAFSQLNLTVPILTVVTDMGNVHLMWFNEVSTFTLVPTERVRDEALEAGLIHDAVRMTGIPVNPGYANPNPSQDEARAALGLDLQRTTLLAVGSSRVPNLLDAVRVVNHSHFPIQLIVAAGGNDEDYAALQATEWHLPALIYNFADDMPLLTRAADAVIGKAGGLFVTETLAAGRPLLLIDVIEGQETYNAGFVVENGAGDIAKTPVEMFEALYHWLNDDGRLLHDRAANARRIGRPRAADDVAALAWALAHGDAPPPVSR